MKSVPVLLITHDDLLWQRGARSRALAGCPRARAGRPSAGATRAVPGRAGRRPAAAAVLAGRRLGADPGRPQPVGRQRQPRRTGHRSWPRAPKATATATPRRRPGTGPGGHLHGRHLDGPFLVSRLLRLVAEGQDAGDWDGGLLTERETTAARYAAGGWATQIAEALGITERTVKSVGGFRETGRVRPPAVGAAGARHLLA